VRALAAGGDLSPHGALASALDDRTGGLHQHRQVTAEHIGAVAGQPQQPVAFGLDLLAVVEDVGDVRARRGQPGGQPQRDRHPGLHVAAPAAVEQAVLAAGGKVARDRHRVDVPGQDYPLRAAQRGPRDDRVAVAVHGQVRPVA
jgi:hypothetical protein